MIKNFTLQFTQIKFANALAVIAIALFLHACATSGVTGTSTPGAEKNADKVIVENKVLAQKIAIRNFKSKVAGDILHAQVTIANDFSSTQEFQYRFAWFDESGFEIEIESEGWTPIVLHGKEEKGVQAVAPNSAVKSYKIVLRAQ